MISIELDELSENEYGSDLIYNNLPATYYYDDFSDNDSVVYENGNQDADLDDQFAFDYVGRNESYDKEWLLWYVYIYFCIEYSFFIFYLFSFFFFYFVRN